MTGIDTKTIGKIKNAYDILKDHPLDPDRDPMKKIHNILDFISVIVDIKPVFYYGDDDLDENAVPVLVAIARENGLTAKFGSCYRNYEFLHNIRTVPIELIRRYITYRQEMDSHKTALWIYKNPDSKILKNINHRNQSEFDHLMGYPGCCVNHNDLILSQIHEFYLNQLLSSSNANEPDKFIERIENPDTPQPDISQIIRPYYKKRINRYPYLSHSPCPDCLKNQDSPSALINQQRRELANRLDSGIHEFLEDFTRTYNQVFP